MRFLRSGWTAVALICLATLLLWTPDLNLPFGNSDDGRIFARAGLQARNFWEMGPLESGLGTRLDPYVRAEYSIAPRTEPPEAATTYAHHPPLKQLLTIGSVGVLGDSLSAIRLTDFVLGAATVAFMASVLRTVGFSWGPTLVALGVMTSTGFFYVYARMGISFSLLLALTAAVAGLRRTPDPPRWALWGTALLAALTAMHSWIALAAIGLLMAWLFAGSPSRKAGRWSRALTAVIVGAATGGLATAAWLLNGTDVAELVERVAFRTGNDVSTAAQQAHVTFGEFLSRQWAFASHEMLTSWWLRAALVPALALGLIDRRSRAPVVVTLVVAASLTFVLQQGAWIHRLWNFPWVAPVTIGCAALADAVRRALHGRAAALRWPLGALMGVLIVATLLSVVRGPTRSYYLTGPADAGAVLEQAVANAPQHVEAAELVWFTSGISTPRWMSYYLRLPVSQLGAEQADQVVPGDLVLVQNDRVPDFMGETVKVSELVAGESYTLLVAGETVHGARGW